jgi:hypothetical protein
MSEVGLLFQDVDGLMDALEGINVRCFFDEFLNKIVNLFNSNLNTKKPVEVRKWGLYFYNNIGTKTKKIELNACALYKEHEDTIIMTRDFYKGIYLFFLNIDKNIPHACWMATVAICFCLAHEMSHLYAGHCQLCKKNTLFINYNKKTGLSYMEHQSFEMTADLIAAEMISDLIAVMLRDNWHKKTYAYDDKEFFLSDSIKAITGFFYFLRSLGADNVVPLDQCTHPPTFIRCYESGLRFIHHSSSFYGNNKDALLKFFYYNTDSKENTFSEIYGIEPFLFRNQEAYPVAIYLENLFDLLNTELKNKLVKYNRLPYDKWHLESLNFM